MINIPWQVRLLVNVGVVLVPVHFLANNIDILTRIPERNNRLLRRLTYERVRLRSEPYMSVEKSREFYANNGFESDN